MGHPFKSIPTEDAELAARLFHERYPRSNRYNPRWVLENLMGPNPLWLAEYLSEEVNLRPGMRVLDLGCGKATTSIWFADEFGVKVWANDLWIDPTENWQRVITCRKEDSVFPLRAEAHDLPYPQGFFDAIVCLDAYEYFGTSDTYINYISKFLKPGGVLGIVDPGLRTEIDEVPAHLRPYWQPDFFAWHSPEWWRRNWSRSGAVSVLGAEFLEEGWSNWLRWQHVCRDYGYVPEQFREWVVKEIEMLEADQGRSLGFTRVTGTRV